MTSTTTAQPDGQDAPPPPSLAPRRRVASVDVLRGVAILGTLASNIWIFTIGFGEEGPLTLVGEDVTYAISNVTALLVNGKFLALLSILFGVGMAILFEASRRRGHRWPLRYWWRSAVLVLVGFLNYLFIVEFDILMSYGLTAILVAPLLLLRGWWLAVAGAVLAAFHLAMETYRLLITNPALLAEARAALDAFARRTGAEDPLAARDALLARAGASGLSYLEGVQFRIENFWDGRVEAFTVAPPLTATLMVVGVGLWRSGIFTRPAETRRLQWTLASGGLVVGLGLSVVAAVPGLPVGFTDTLWELGRYTLAPVAALGYLGVGLLLMRRFPDAWLSRRLSAVGRAALSCYLLQNLVASVLFFEWGLGLGPLDGVGTIIAWAALSAFLVVFAEIWLRRFRTGPFEIAWRWLADAPFRTRRTA